MERARARARRVNRENVAMQKTGHSLTESGEGRGWGGAGRGGGEGRGGLFLRLPGNNLEADNTRRSCNLAASAGADDDDDDDGECVARFHTLSRAAEERRGRMGRGAAC